MPEPIEHEYFNWLCAKVLPIGGRNNMYLDLMRILHQTEFVWVIPGDRNRAEDGCELRIYFLRASRWEVDQEWYEEPCSMLEMLIALGDRAYFQTDRPAKAWFWEFLENLELSEYRHISDVDKRRIQDILHNLVWRTYEPSGYGGIFPLRQPKQDQRRVEIWYQFCEYVEDRGLY